MGGRLLGRIEELKEKLGAKTKVEVVRAGLHLLELETERKSRIELWKNAARAVAGSSSKINREFRTHSRLKRK